ncbi:MAG: CarD family transcriptional regulator [Limnochordia bacterium]|nr:CarD family transcriptional regulator [Limnochordia bacterium]MDI9465913.1 CarD family transcriptional regulator [Bacillota bacterium]NLO96186.1 CarD family transcriptional regulator [Bacillota bacterium]HAI53079.1 CarD family transcriptional regulator [Bacillota bacterium]HAN94328.1 CarD family transcriptional regulator [Bacillota bacterium]
MYNVGDHVVYPMHGAGVIVAIEEREVLGERQKYYIMQLPIGDMKVMIPMNAVDDLGLRQVIGPEEVERVYQVLQGEETAMSSNWNRRYRANMEKIKSGDIYEVAEVVRNLTIRDIEKGLSTGERKMLDTARQILVSELVIAQNSTREEVEEAIQEIFQQ